MNALANSVLHLEPQVLSHADAMFEVLSDPAIYEHENDPPSSLDWLRERFRRLESRLSPDETEHWLNWVILLPSSELIGFVQATVYPSRRAAIAYELNSRYWGKGLATAAVDLMITELVANYDVKMLSAVLKKTNVRSRRLLERMGFSLAREVQHQQCAVEPDEVLMSRSAVAK